MNNFEKWFEETSENIYGSASLLIFHNNKDMMKDAFEAGQHRNVIFESVLKNWLSSQDAPDKIMLVRGENPISANDMISEIENNSKIGSEFRDNIIALAIDMVSRESKYIKTLPDFGAEHF